MQYPETKVGFSLIYKFGLKLHKRYIFVYSPSRFAFLNTSSKKLCIYVYV